MKITARASALDAALSLATTGIRANKNPGTIRAVAGRNAVSFTCCAPGIAITVTADANIDEPGDVAVSDRLGGLIAGVPSNSTITITDTASAVMIACDQGRYRLPAILDAPAALAMDYEIASIEMTGDDLLTLFEVLPAAGTEAARPYLNGTHLHSVGDQLIGVATDGVKLLRTSIPAEHFLDDPRFIVPTKTATALMKLLKATKPDKITLRRSGTLFAVKGPSFELVASLLDYKYPSYECLLPRVSTNVALCNHSELIDVLARLDAVAHTEPTPLVALSWTDGGRLRLFLPRQPGDADDAIPAEARGSAQIALSLRQLTAMIGNFTADRLQLESTDANTPLVLRGDGEKLGVLVSCCWNFETGKRPASTRSGAAPNAMSGSATRNENSDVKSIS